MLHKRHALPRHCSQWNARSSSRSEGSSFRWSTRGFDCFLFYQRRPPISLRSYLAQIFLLLKLFLHARVRHVYQSAALCSSCTSAHRRKISLKSSQLLSNKQDQSCFNHSSLHAFPKTGFEVPAGQDAIAVNNERLETLGDAVLKASMTVQIFDTFPGLTPGGTTVVRAELERNDYLAPISIEYGLPYKLRTLAANRDFILAQTKVQADVFEAYVGAVYRQYGWQITHDWLVKVFEGDLRDAYTRGKADSRWAIATADAVNHVGKLLEWAIRQQPRRIITWMPEPPTGPAHAPQFQVNCLINGVVNGVGFASTVRIAKNR
jgi:dsRNA-specific ribonuclease